MKRIIKLTENQLKDIVSKVIKEQGAPIGNPNLKSQLNPIKNNQKVPYQVNKGWWTGTNVEKFVKSYTKEPEVVGNGENYIWGTVGNVDWNFEQNGSFFTSKIGDVDEIEKGTWKDNNGSIEITLGTKKFNSKDNKWSNGISTVNCAPQLIDTSKGKMLKFGCKTQGVKELQNLLDVTPITGYFGNKTLAAVKALQTSKNIKVDGIVGIETYPYVLANGQTNTPIPGSDTQGTNVTPPAQDVSEDEDIAMLDNLFTKD
jgi:hypothetical protein